MRKEQGLQVLERGEHREYLVIVEGNNCRANTTIPGYQHLTGYGNTPEEALSNLKEKIKREKK